MKRFLLLIIFALGTLTCSAQKAKSFFYGGIELHNVKGWSIVPSKDDQRTVIQCVNLPLQMTITKQGALKNKSLDSYLMQQVEAFLEASMATAGKAPKVKETGPVMDGFVNNIPAKYIDITYTKKMRQRIYAMNMYNYTITILCTGEGSVIPSSNNDAFIEKNFGKILSKFAFTPESGTHRLF